MPGCVHSQQARSVLASARLSWVRTCDCSTSISPKASGDSPSERIRRRAARSRSYRSRSMATTIFRKASISDASKACSGCVDIALDLSTSGSRTIISSFGRYDYWFATLILMAGVCWGVRVASPLPYYAARAKLRFRGESGRARSPLPNPHPFHQNCSDEAQRSLLDVDVGDVRSMLSIRQNTCVPSARRV